MDNLIPASLAPGAIGAVLGSAGTALAQWIKSRYDRKDTAGKQLADAAAAWRELADRLQNRAVEFDVHIKQCEKETAQCLEEQARMRLQIAKMERRILWLRRGMREKGMLFEDMPHLYDGDPSDGGGNA